jgi:hypothetical protein
MKQLLEEIMAYLDEDVQEMISGNDWLGTGSSYKAAEAEQKEYQDRLDFIRDKIVNAKW